VCNRFCALLAASLRPQVKSGYSGCDKTTDGQITKSLSIPLRKNIPLPSSGKSVIQIRPSRPTRGALRTSRSARWDAVDAKTAATNA
jgi:hypothetical protein